MFQLHLYGSSDRLTWEEIADFRTRTSNPAFVDHGVNHGVWKVPLDVIEVEMPSANRLGSASGVSVIAARPIDTLVSMLSLIHCP